MPRHPKFNNYRVAGDTAYLTLTNRKGEVVAEALVDAADLPLLMEYGRRWCQTQVRNTGSSYVQSRKGGKTTYLHRLLMPGTEQVDHVSGNGLDNRRANLRACSATENQGNRRRNANNTSGFKGVYWNKAAKKWQAYITKDGQQRYLGVFSAAEDAARAYDRAARVLHGEFARLNFPDQPPVLGKAVGL